MEENNYNISESYCEKAKNFQAVPSNEQYGLQHPEVSPADYDDKRSQTLYSCPDNYQMGCIQDNQIYIATTDAQHNQIIKGEHVSAHGGLSGYFSDQATIDASKDNDVLDNTKYNEATQIAPWREDISCDGEGDAFYKPHIDCFAIDRDKLYENYGTYDFNAAIAKCEANNQFGSGGGNQGYNPYISEMIENGTLKHDAGRSYSDTSISRSEYNNPNKLSNSIVPEEKADMIYSNAQTRAADCVKNETPHPSSEACNNGFSKENAIQLNCNTGHATEWKQNKSEGANTENIVLKPKPKVDSENQVRGSPNQELKPKSMQETNLTRNAALQDAPLKAKESAVRSENSAFNVQGVNDLQKNTPGLEATTLTGLHT